MLRKDLGVGEQDSKKGELSRKLCSKYQNYVAFQCKMDGCSLLHCTGNFKNYLRCFSMLGN